MLYKLVVELTVKMKFIFIYKVHPGQVAHHQVHGMAQIWQVPPFCLASFLFDHF